MNAAIRIFGVLVLSAPWLRVSVAQESAVTFQDHVLPIFATHCNGCHNADKKKGDLDLTSYSAALAGGGSGELAASGDSAGSMLFKVIAHLSDPKMPPKKPKISDAEILTIKKWIDGGLIDAPGGKAKKSKGPAVDLTLKAGATGKPKGPAAMPQDLLLEPTIRTTKAEAVTALATSPWAPLAAVAGQHQVLLYNTDTLELAGILPFPERRPTVLRFSRNGSILLAAGGQGAKIGRVVLYDVKSGDRATEIGEEFDQVLAADLSPDQGLVAFGGPGKLVKIYDTKDGSLEHSIKKHTDWVTALEFSPDGALLASGDRSGGLHVWEAKTGRILYTLTGHKGAITDLSWRADANLLASSSEDGQVILWEMAGGTRAKGWAAHPATACVKYAMDGRLVTCGRDMLVRTWDGNGAKQKDFEAFADLALRAVFTHDGARVIAGDWTGEIRVWNAADAKRVGQLSTNPPPLAERVAADQKALEAAEAESAKAAAALAAAEQAFKAAEAGEKPADATPVTQARQAAESAAARLAQAKNRVALDKAAEFNVQVHAAKRDLAKVQAEQEALNAKAEAARHAAADAESKAKAGEQAVGAAQAKIKPAQAALAEAQAGPAKAEAVQKAALKVQADKEAVAAQAQALAAQLADSAGKAADDNLTRAAARAKEAADLVAKDAADAKAAAAARTADVEKARAAVTVAEKALADAQAGADQAIKNAAALKTAAKASADGVAPAQAQADAFKPKVDAARAKVEALKADYLKLKPKSP